jgi:hypothetical protein
VNFLITVCSASICFGGDSDGGKLGGVRLDASSYFLIDGLPLITHMQVDL